MDALDHVLKSHPGPSVLVFSLIFRVVYQLLLRFPVPKVVTENELSLWKWRNLSMSMVHSILTGTWALTCVVIWPETLSNLYAFHTPLSYLLVCLSTGYFVQDVGDIILTGHGRGSWEFLLHHAVVISCFLYTLFSQIFVAGATLALFVEVNSVTLHLRLMLKLAGAQYSPGYHINKFVNIFTYVTFRLGTQFYLTWYILHNYSSIKNPGFFLGCMIPINLMMIIYFYRLLRSDFLSPRRSSAGTEWDTKQLQKVPHRLKVFTGLLKGE